ncbi:NosD domain-containing protein [Opitutus sp. ER46]|uniref:NosD domain-containing protein n=1 Tax=Opitutus sp. ER46 TaxID=2161864 RepID=UPI000D3128BD|nr:NosD domain-containing protein [Opitutus sp. ER46]PTX98402.1 hypothetical protein DB354_03795 [Opitutus sp. ER46]
MHSDRSLRSITRVALIGSLLVALAQPVVATTYYVAKNGAETNAGTSLAAPFLRIQQAADVMVAGDTCYIRQGTYRETVTPANSGTSTAAITFAPYGTEKVIVSGADVLSTTWSAYSGSIYATSTTASFRQLFVDGVMMNEARWPNAQVENLLEAPQARVDSGSYSSLVDAALPAVDLTGAKMHLYPGNQGGAFAANTRTIATHDQATQTLTWVGNTSYGVYQGTPYTLYGKLGLLDIPTEWHLDTATGTLYLWAPDGASPASHVVEIKARAAAFMLDGKSSVTVRGLYVFAAGISMANTTSCLVEGCHLRHIQHDTTADWTNGAIVPACLTSGTGSTWRDSTIYFSSQDGIVLKGTAARVENCVIGEVDYYPGHYHAAVNCDSGSGHIVTGNTMARSGRYLVEPQNGTGLDVSYNDLSYGGRLTADCGAVYTHTIDGLGTNIHHNWIHHNESGMYFDLQSVNYNLYKNVFTANTHGVRFGQGSRNNIYNNTMVGNGVSIQKAGTLTTQAGTYIINNLADAAITYHPDATVSNNGWFPPVGPDYVPQAGSGAIDAGLVASPFTDGYVGSAPDLGAYEVGGTDWVAGASITLPAFPTLGSTAVPPAPTGVVAQPRFDGIEITWVPSPTFVSSYNIKRALRSTGTYTTIGTVLSGASYVDATAPTGATYSYVVSAVNSVGESANSASARAMSRIPSPWNNADIGLKLRDGGAALNSGTWTLKGGGGDIGGTADSFNYTYEPMTGDGVIIARLAAQDVVSNNSKVGLMMRESLAAGSVHAAVVIDGNQGSPKARLAYRTSTGANTGWAAATVLGPVLPAWLKLQRAGTTFSAAISFDGTTWTEVGVPTQVSMASTIYVGFAVCSRNGNGTLTTMTYDQVTAPWWDADIGTTALGGSCTYADGVYTIKGSGSDLGGTADNVNFAYRSLTGNGSIVARLASETTAGSYDKVGVMMRDSLAANARMVTVLLNSALGSPPPTTYFGSRSTTGGGTSWVAGSSGWTLPVWFKLERSGNTFTGYTSSNGTTWTAVGSVTIAGMPATVYLGLADCARSSTTLNTSTFDNVTW